MQPRQSFVPSGPVLVRLLTDDCRVCCVLRHFSCFSCAHTGPGNSTPAADNEDRRSQEQVRHAEHIVCKCALQPQAGSNCCPHPWHYFAHGSALCGFMCVWSPSSCVCTCAGTTSCAHWLPCSLAGLTSWTMQHQRPWRCGCAAGGCVLLCVWRGAGVQNRVACRAC